MQNEDSATYSLGAGDLASYVRTNRTFFEQAMDEAARLTERTKDLDEDAEVTIPTASLRMMRQAMVAMNKMAHDSSVDSENALWNGDKGANCDYNPFKKVNF